MRQQDDQALRAASSSLIRASTQDGRDRAGSDPWPDATQLQAPAGRAGRRGEPDASAQARSQDAGSRRTTLRDAASSRARPASSPGPQAGSPGWWYPLPYLPLQQRAQQALGGFLVAPALDEDVEHEAVLVDSNSVMLRTEAAFGRFPSYPLERENVPSFASTLPTSVESQRLSGVQTARMHLVGFLCRMCAGHVSMSSYLRLCHRP